MQYSTYQFYRDTFHGTVITDEDAFSRCELMARYTVDRITFGRLKRESYSSVEDVPEVVQLAVCAAAEYAKQADETGGRMIASETTSKHSVSYADTSAGGTVESEMALRAMKFLAGTPWVYRGVYPNEWNRHHYHH